MSAIAPREVPEETEPGIERPRPANEPKISRPRDAAVARFVFMWDGWRSEQLEDNFVLA
jgi:hypothetical protein